MRSQRAWQHTYHQPWGKLHYKMVMEHSADGALGTKAEAGQQMNRDKMTGGRTRGPALRSSPGPRSQQASLLLASHKTFKLKAQTFIGLGGKQARTIQRGSSARSMVTDVLTARRAIQLVQIRQGMAKRVFMTHNAAQRCHHSLNSGEVANAQASAAIRQCQLSIYVACRARSPSRYAAIWPTQNAMTGRTKKRLAGDVHRKSEIPQPGSTQNLRQQHSCASLWVAPSKSVTGF